MTRRRGRPWPHRGSKKYRSQNFGLNFWGRGSAERIWGEFFILAWWILGKWPVNFSATFDGELFPQIFQPCFFFLGFRPPPSKKKNHAQNSRPKIVGIPLKLHFLEPFFFTPIFCLRGRSRISVPYLRNRDIKGWTGSQWPFWGAPCAPYPEHLCRLKQGQCCDGCYIFSKLCRSSLHR